MQLGTHCCLRALISTLYELENCLSAVCRFLASRVSFLNPEAQDTFGSSPRHRLIEILCKEQLKNSVKVRRRGRSSLVSLDTTGVQR